MGEEQTDAQAPTPLKSRLMWGVFGFLAVAVVYLRWQGRVWWCACGEWYPVALHVHGMHSSQHLLDMYSLSHVLHGVVFFGFLWLFRRQISLPWRAALAAGFEIAWEMLENSPAIVERYRAATVSYGYTGDSIANSLGDIGSFVLGFYIARKIGLWRSVVLYVVLELLMLWLIRDNLTLNVVMLLWPIDAVRKWQAQG